IGRLVVGQYVAAAIENQAAAGRYRVEPYAVALGELHVIVMAKHLQVAQAREQRQPQHADHQHGADRALRKDALLGPLVFDADARAHEFISVSYETGRALRPRPARSGRRSAYAPSALAWRADGRSSRRSPRAGIHKPSAPQIQTAIAQIAAWRALAGAGGWPGRWYMPAPAHVSRATDPAGHRARARWQNPAAGRRCAES